MEITLDKIDKTEALIKVTLKEADYQPAISRKIKEYSKKANIKGFRAGKVPEGMIKSMYGKSLLVDEINHMLSHKLSDYIRESELQFLGEPLPNRTKAEAIDWDSQKDFDFEYSIGFAKEFDLKIDKKIKIEKFKIKVDTQVIDETIENLQRQFGEPEVVETVGEKDFVHGPVTSIDGKIDKELKVDMRELERGSYKKFKGEKVGSRISIEAKKVYKSPNLLKYQLGLTDDEYKKIKGKLTFTIGAIQRIKEVPVDQALFDKTFGAGVIDSLEAFKTKVKEAVSKNYVNEESQFFNYKLREQLTEKARIELPDKFLKRWLKETNEEMTDEILDKEYSSYAAELKWSLIKNRILKNQDIKIENEEVVAEAKNLIRQQFASSGISDSLEDQLDVFANNYLQGEKGENYMKVFNQVQGRRVMDFLHNEITIKDKEISLEAFRKLD